MFESEMGYLEMLGLRERERERIGAVEEGSDVRHKNSNCGYGWWMGWWCGWRGLGEESGFPFVGVRGVLGAGIGSFGEEEIFLIIAPVCLSVCLFGSFLFVFPPVIILFF